MQQKCYMRQEDCSASCTCIQEGFTSLWQTICVQTNIQLSAKMLRMVHRLTQTPSPTLEMRASLASASCVFRDTSVTRSWSHELTKPAQTVRKRKLPIIKPNDLIYAYCAPKKNKCRPTSYLNIVFL